MKISTILTIICFSFLIISCQKKEQKLQLKTRTIEIENIKFDLPTIFKQNKPNNWMFDDGKKIATIDINKSEKTELNSVLEDLKSKELESDSDKYTLIETKKGDTLNKQYILETYKYNNSDYPFGYPVYSYETYSAVKINDEFLAIHSFSLGLNLNDTMKKSILNIKKAVNY